MPIEHLYEVTEGKQLLVNTVIISVQKIQILRMLLLSN